jgi:hypothetical protein
MAELAASPSSAGGQSPPLSTAPTAIETIRSTSSGECSVCMSLRESDQDYLEKPCHGWPRLVDVMVERPGFQCFPAFKDLNIKSLLYYQAELDKFRQELRDLEWDHHHDVNPRLCSDVEVLLEAKNEGAKQMKMVKDMRQVLKEYSKTFIQVPLLKYTR